MNNSQSLKLFVVMCRTFSNITDAVKADIKTFGLSLSEFGALELIYHKGSQTVQQIGKKVLLTSGSMTYVVDQLEKKGLAKRRICETDKRIFYVELTEKGKLLLDEIFPLHANRIAEIFSTLEVDEIVDLTEKLKQISKSISK